MNVNPFSKIQIVDDKANRFLPPSNMSWINNANLNDDKYKEGGLYCIGSASTNSPGNWGLLTVLKPRNDAIMQYYAVNNVMYHRDYTGGSWQSWKTFADTSDLNWNLIQANIESGTTINFDATKYHEIMIVPMANGSAWYNPFTVTSDLPSNVYFSVYQDGTYHAAAHIVYNSGTKKITYTTDSVAGWARLYITIYAR